MRIYIWIVKLCLVCLIYGIVLKSVSALREVSVVYEYDMSAREMDPDKFNEYSDEMKEIYKLVKKDIKIFPVAYSEECKFVSYSNSWGVERTYGGSRLHEGTDIMGLMNERGHYPIISASDGVVEEMGWLELGGYRIGIRTKGGVYLYYAHLYSFAPGMKKGNKVSAGELLGYMGDSGYSKVEGTVGNFDVHLHFGIYVITDEYGELSINPYYFLKSIENNLVIYNY